MKYVIDASVDIKTYVQEQGSAKAVRLRNEYHQGIHELFVPDIFPTEMCNVLMILERSGKINELVTADDKLVKAVQPTLPFVLHLSKLP